jgi:hypothetical protein
LVAISRPAATKVRFGGEKPLGTRMTGAAFDEDGLGACQPWLYVTILTVGYMVSRGLAKSGSREPYDEDR